MVLDPSPPPLVVRILTYKSPHIHVWIYTYFLARIHTLAFLLYVHKTHTHTHTYTCTLTYVFPQTHMRIHTHPHAHAHLSPTGALKHFIKQKNLLLSTYNPTPRYASLHVFACTHTCTLTHFLQMWVGMFKYLYPFALYIPRKREDTLHLIFWIYRNPWEYLGIPLCMYRIQNIKCRVCSRLRGI